jgi:hypothetical protein
VAGELDDRSAGTEPGTRPEGMGQLTVLSHSGTSGTSEEWTDPSAALLIRDIGTDRSSLAPIFPGTTSIAPLTN